MSQQTIIITWGAGFIGSNFLSKYVLLFPEVQFVNIDMLTYAGNIEKISPETRNAQNYHFEQVDIRDIDAVRSVYQKYNPTDIIHFAAESHVDNSIKNPRLFTEVNVLGTQNLLDLHREFGMKRFHYISTDEVYWDIPESGFFTEETHIEPSSPYSASKAGGDILVQAYGRTFGLDYTITRCSNNYGANQNFISLIPLFISKIEKNEKVPLYGDGSNIRDWLYVEDHCDAIWEVFIRANKGSIYNVGGNNEYTNLEITRILLQAMWKSEDLISFVPDRPWHDKRYAIDATKIRDELGWEPKVRFEEGIARTIKSYQNRSLPVVLPESHLESISTKKLKEWNIQKIVLDNEDATDILFAEGEVWWCRVGQNLWVEIYGKWEEFTRPVLVLKKTGKRSFIGIPSTTKFENIRNKNMISRVFHFEYDSVFRYDQIKNFDTVRLWQRITTLMQSDFQDIQSGCMEYLLATQTKIFPHIAMGAEGNP